MAHPTGSLPLLRRGNLQPPAILSLGTAYKTFLPLNNEQWVRTRKNRQLNKRTYSLKVVLPSNLGVTTLSFLDALLLC